MQEPYTYIIFRASEVKDLAVDEPAAQQRRNVHDDPAVLGVSVLLSSVSFVASARMMKALTDVTSKARKSESAKNRVDIPLPSF